MTKRKRKRKKKKKGEENSGERERERNSKIPKKTAHLPHLYQQMNKKLH
jgi:hypothetical protein